MPTPGELYCNTLLVRVVAPDFVAGMLLDPVTQRVVFAAPLLRHLVGQHRDKLRQGFDRLGWRATIVPRAFNIDRIHEERLERMREHDREAVAEAHAAPVVQLKEKPKRPAAKRKPRHKAGRAA